MVSDQTKNKTFAGLRIGVLIAALCLIFLQSLSNFFFADDWFHLRVSQVHSVGEWANFFSFAHTAQYAGSYRPLPTQAFFWLFQSLFGLNPLPYHLFASSIFIGNLILLNLLAKKLFSNRKIGTITLFLYGISATNFPRLYFISAFQEVLMVFFTLLTAVFYLNQNRSRIWPCTFFILALLSKETAVVVPGILFLLDWYQREISLKRLFPFIFIAIIYAILRFGKLGGIAGESYLWDFTPKKVANSLFWYGLWTSGAPEFLVDYVTSGLRLLPRFFVNFGFWSYPILALAAASLGSFFALVLLRLKTSWRGLVLGAGIFVGSLVPVIFLPLHKFTLELGLPLVGFSLAAAMLLSHRSKMAYLFITVYALTNVVTNLLLTKYHYTINQAKLSQKVFQYFKSTYPMAPEGKYFEFINDTSDFGPQWGSSKQIAQVTSSSNMFAVLYRDPTYQVYFDDFPTTKPKGKTPILISTKMFTGE